MDAQVSSLAGWRILLKINNTFSMQKMIRKYFLPKFPREELFWVFLGVYFAWYLPSSGMSPQRHGGPSGTAAPSGLDPGPCHPGPPSPRDAGPDGCPDGCGLPGTARQCPYLGGLLRMPIISNPS